MNLTPIRYGVAYKSNTNIVAGTSEQVFAPGTNVNGVILWRAGGRSFNGTAPSAYNLAAHTAAPNSLTVGDVIAVADSSMSNAATIFETFLKFEAGAWGLLIPAGKGLYFNVAQSETSSLRQVLYTVL